MNRLWVAVAAIFCSVSVQAPRKARSPRSPIASSAARRVPRRARKTQRSAPAKFTEKTATRAGKFVEKTATKVDKSVRKALE